MKVIPSLTEEGWVTDSRKILDYLLAYYILSDTSQSISYQGNIINLPETYYRNINDPTGMMTGVRDDLDKLLSKYFTSVELTVEVKELTKSKYGILIYAAVIDENNNRTELTKITELSDSKSRKIINLSNYGDGISLLNSL